MPENPRTVSGAEAERFGEFANGQRSRGRKVWESVSGQQRQKRLRIRERSRSRGERLKNLRIFAGAMVRKI